MERGSEKTISDFFFLLVVEVRIRISKREKTFHDGNISVSMTLCPITTFSMIILEKRP